MIWRTSEFFLFVLVCAFFILAMVFGHWMGKRAWTKKGQDEVTASHVQSMQSALLGLLALLLGFTFAMGISRFDKRQDLVAAEANAIGTAYMRTAFLPSYARKEIRSLFNSYVDSRIDFYSAGIDSDMLASSNQKSADVLNQLWLSSVQGAKATNPPQLAGLYIAALNEMIDVNEERQSAFENRVPEAVLWLLFFTAFMSLGLVGYCCGMNSKRPGVTSVMFALTIAAVLIVVLDVDRPRRGLITVNQSSMLRVQQYIKSGKMPPMPDDLAVAESLDPEPVDPRETGGDDNTSDKN